MRKSVLISAAVSALLAGTSAHAQNVLYRVDFITGTDRIAEALAASGFTVTDTSGDLSGFTLSNYDAVVYANQGNSQPGGDAALLTAYIAGGGRVVYQNWTTDNTDLPALNSAFDGGFNQTSMTLSMFDAGLTSPVTLTNPGWGVFSTDLTALAGGTVAATFGNGSAAIVVGNGGRTIHNGFLSDTLSSSQLYQNQFRSLFQPSAAVPEPATWLMMILGFGAIGYGMRRQRTTAKVSFA